MSTAQQMGSRSPRALPTAPPAKDPSLPSCPLCMENLGTYGGPTTLPCGHNLCLHCAVYLQQRQSKCPLCRADFPQDLQLAVNCELRELMRLAQALTATAVEGEDGWQAVHSAARVDIGACLNKQGGSNSPSHPPSPVGLVDVMDGSGSVMELHPQPWEPDSSSATCRAPGCRKPFSFLLRPRHHCRCCGQLFCGSCTSERLLLPPRFQEAEPQRVCRACRELLLPIQPLLAGSITPAVRQPVHDVTDWSAMRSLLNPPLSSRLDTDIYTATNILRAATAAQAASLPLERAIPPAILQGCAGMAIMSVARAAAGWSVSVGSGLVVARAPGGGWSPPSAVLSLASSVGWQLGVEVQDLVLVLRSQAALNAFCASQLGVGGSVSLAAGPVGRIASATALANLGGGALVYGYCCTRGAFAGVAVEGTLLATRDSLNQQFYGRKVSARQLLVSGTVPPPPAAAALYSVLDGLLEQAAQLATPQFLCQAGGQEGDDVLPPSAMASAPPLPRSLSHAAGGAAVRCREADSSDEDEWESDEDSPPAAALPQQWGRHIEHQAPRGRSFACGGVAGGQLYPSPLSHDDELQPYGCLFD